MPATIEPSPISTHAKNASPLLVLSPMYSVDGECTPLRPGRTTIGSSPKCTITLSGKGVEPLHCLIVAERGKAVAKSSAPKTWLNDAPLRQAVLRDGDVLAVGAFTFQITAGDANDFALAESLPELDTGLALDEFKSETARTEAVQPEPTDPVVELGETSDDATPEVIEEPANVAVEVEVNEIRRELAPPVVTAPKATPPIAVDPTEDVAQQQRVLDELLERQREVAADLERRERQTVQFERTVETFKRRKIVIDDLAAALDAHAQELLVRERQTAAQLERDRSDLASRIGRVDLREEDLATRGGLLDEREREFHERVNEFDARRSEWETEVVERENENERLRQRLNERDQELAALAAGLDARQKQVHLREQNGNQRAAEMIEREAALEARESALLGEQSAFEAASLQRNAELDSTAAAQRANEQQLASREEAVRELEERLKRNTSALKGENLRLEQRSESLEDAERTLEREMNRVHHEQETLRAQRETLSDSRRKLVEERERFEADRALVREERRDLDRLRRECAARTALLPSQAVFQRDLEATRGELAAESNRLAAERARHEERDGWLSIREQTFERIQTELDERGRELDEAIANVERTGVDNESRREKLEARTVELESRLDETRRESEELESDRLALEAEWQRVKAESSRVETDREALKAERAELDAAQIAVEDARNKHAQDEQNLARRREELDADVERVSESRTDLAQEQERFEIQQRELEAARTELDERSRRLEAEEARVAEEALECEQRRAELERESETLSESQQSLDDGRTRLDAVADELDARRTEIETTREELQAERNALGVERDRLTTEADALAARETALDSQSRELDAERTELEERRGSLAADDARIAEQSREFEQQRAELERESQAVSESLQSLEDDQKRLESNAGELEAQRVELETAREELQTERDALAVERDRLTTEPDALAARETDAGDMETQRVEFETIREELQSERNALAAERDRLTTESEALAARETSLGSRTQELDAEREELDERTRRFEAEEQRIAEEASELELRRVELERESEAIAESRQAVEHEPSGRDADSDELPHHDDNDAVIDVRQIEDAAKDLVDDAAPSATVVFDHDEAFSAAVEGLEWNASEVDDVASDEVDFEADAIGDEAEIVPEPAAEEDAPSIETVVLDFSDVDDAEPTLLESVEIELNGDEVDSDDVFRTLTFDEIRESVPTSKSATAGAPAREPSNGSFAFDDATESGDVDERLDAYFDGMPFDGGEADAEDSSDQVAVEDPSHSEAGEDVDEQIQNMLAGFGAELDELESPAELTDNPTDGVEVDAGEEASSDVDETSNEDDDGQLTELRSTLADMFDLATDDLSTMDHGREEEPVDAERLDEAGAEFDADADLFVEAEDVFEVDDEEFPDSRLEQVEDSSAPDVEVSVNDQTAGTTPLDDEDDSVAAYMQRLLQRTRKGGDAGVDSRYVAESKSKTPPSTANTSDERLAGHESNLAEAGDVAHSELATKPPQDKDAIRAGMASMRELANQTARSAIARHSAKKLRGMLAAKVVLTALSLGMAGVLLTAPLWAGTSYLTIGLGTLVIGLLIAGDLGRTIYGIRKNQAVVGAFASEVVDEDSIEAEYLPIRKPSVAEDEELPEGADD